MKDAILRIVLIILGIVCCLYCGCVIMIIGTGSWFNFAFGIVGVVLIADGIFLSALKSLTKNVLRLFLLFLSLQFFFALLILESLKQGQSNMDLQYQKKARLGL